MKRAKFPKRKSGETLSHLRAKNSISKTLHEHLTASKSNLFELKISNPCLNQGWFFRCNNAKIQTLLRLENLENIAVLKEYSEKISRFDIAFVDLNATKNNNNNNNNDNNVANNSIQSSNSILTARNSSTSSVDARSFQHLYAEISEFAEKATKPSKPLILSGLNSFQRRAAHILCEAYDHLESTSVGEGFTRSVFIDWVSQTKSKPEPSVVPYTVLGAVEICHSSPMTDRKVESLASDAVPWVEVAASRSLDKWRADQPLNNVLRSSLGEWRCARCEADPSQQSMQFVRVRSIFDVATRGRGRYVLTTRHVFTDIVEPSSNRVNLVRDQLTLNARKWRQSKPGRPLATVPHDNNNDDAHATQFNSIIEQHKQAWRDAGARVNVHVEAPGCAPRDLFPQSDIIGQGRGFRTPTELFPSLSRIFGVKR